MSDDPKSEEQMPSEPERGFDPVDWIIETTKKLLDAVGAILVLAIGASMVLSLATGLCSGGSGEGSYREYRAR